MERRQYSLCISCAENDATPRECGFDLCVVCHPWVAASLCRTGDLPRWGAEMLTHDPEILVRTRDAMKEEGPGTDGPPILGDNWLDYFRWLLGDDDEALREIEQHIELRDDAEYIGEDSVEQMAGKLLCLVDEQEESRELLLDSHWGDGMVLDPDPVVHRFGGYEVEVSSGLFVVDEKTPSKNPETVAELLFDSIPLDKISTSFTINGTAALPRAWRHTTRPSPSPLARAASTYSWASCSIMKLRVMRAI